MLLDQVSLERGKKESPSLLPSPGPGHNRAGQPQARPCQARITQTPFLRARPLNPCPDLQAQGDSEAKGQHAGQGWNVSLLWLAGDSGPPGSGAHEGMYGDHHTGTDLRLLEGVSSASRLGLNTFCWREAVFFF